MKYYRKYHHLKSNLFKKVGKIENRRMREIYYCDNETKKKKLSI